MVGLKARRDNMESEQEKFKLCLQKGEFGKLVKGSLVSPTDRVGREGFSLIHWACFYGRTEALQNFLVLIGPKKVVSIIDKHGWTPLHICAIRNQEECTKLLIDNGANVTTKDNRGYTCGHCAATHGNTLVLQHILAAGHDINLIDARSWTVVHHAAFYGHPTTLQVLAQLGADLSIVDLKGNLPAHLAASEGRLECLRLLVDFNHTPLTVLKARNNKGATPKDLSIQFQKPDCAEFLALRIKQLERVDDGDGEDEEISAHNAIESDNLPLLTSLIQEGECAVNEQDKDGATLAHTAASGGHIGCLRWLIDNGADLSITNNLKESPLDVARKYGNTQCIAIIEESIGLAKSCSFESLDQAKKKIDELEKALELSKETYLKLGGILEEEDKHEREMKDIMEKHQFEISDLKNQLELEREKREVLEKEADSLRLQLHQANETLLHYKTLVAHGELGQDVNTSSNKKKLVTSDSRQRRKEISLGKETIHNKKIGGAYFDLNSPS